MKLEELNAVPLITEDLVAELFGDTSDQEMVDMQKEIWSGIRRDLPKEIEQIRELAGNGSELFRKLCHRVAGYVGSGGLGRCCEVLRAIEYERVPPEEVLVLLDTLPELARESIEAMEERFPHLRLE